ncbi:hypothetical protein UFOVP653_69 [uncultured Caudovirales phage]|uniref:Uncharacterized protein n=1 Tax=uncultured Caudovirales phage TaxID=2100421 RepID=A0A6J5N8J7_9CAUD|nr:hypothetical protein UFOVP653_69 [uncultured Caudovirales phage]
MILGRFFKQPAESLDYDIDFSQFLSDGDSLVTTGNPPVPSPLSVTATPSGLTLGPTFVINGKTIKQWLSGGTDGVRYKITLTATSNAGRIKQVEFVVRVKDE